jgi:large subunit ribosomal protein L25
MLQLEVKTHEPLRKGQAAALRREQQILGVIYGHGVPTRHILFRYPDFEKIYRQTGESTLIGLRVDGAEPVSVLIHDIQTEATSNLVAHVDFHQVRMDEKIHATIKLIFTGESPAVKEQGGMLLTNTHEIEVECLPTALVDSLTVDISGLKTFDDTITVGSIVVPEGMRLISNVEDVIALVQEPRSEAEMAALDEKPTEALPAEAAEPAADAAATDEKAK